MKKKSLIAFIIGAILSSTITVVFAFSLFAEDVDYSPQNTRWQVNNVKLALDDLHSKYEALESSTIDVVSLCSGTSSCSGSSLEIGKAYFCVATSRKYNGTFNITGAEVLLKQENGGFLDYAYTTYRAFIVPTSSTVSFSISNSTGMGVVCYHVTNIK